MCVVPITQSSAHSVVCFYLSFRQSAGSQRWYWNCQNSVRLQNVCRFTLH